MNEGPPMPGSPWFKLAKKEVGNAGSAQQTSQVVVLPIIVQHVTIGSKFSLNPGVLISGRRPDRPGS